MQRPARIVRDLELFYVGAVELDDPAAQARHRVGFAHAGSGCQQSVEGRFLIGLQIDEEETGRAVGQLGFEQARKIRLDQRDRHQHGKPEAERRDDARRRRAAAVEIAQTQTRRGAARMNPPRDKHQSERQQPEQQERHRGAENEIQRDAPIVGAEHREAGSSSAATPVAMR